MYARENYATMEINPYVLNTQDFEFLYLESLCYLELAISICKSKSKRVHFFLCPKEK